MIRRYWRKPNFRVRAVTDFGEKVIWVSGRSKSALEERLQQEFHRVISIETADFKEWIKEAESATSELASAIESSQNVSFKERLWKGLRWHLLDLFRGKCAYCDAKLKHVMIEHVEHFRPRSKPKEAAASHPGYWWLAYSFKNYLPSCSLCNSALKANKFPLKNEFTRAFDPSSVREEVPLLVNPLSDNPSRYFFFSGTGEVGVKKGVDKLTGLKASTSIDVYGLDLKRRTEHRRSILKEWGLQLDCISIEWSCCDAQLNSLKRIRPGDDDEYYLSRLAYFDDWLERKKEDVARKSNETLDALTDLQKKPSRNETPSSN